MARMKWMSFTQRGGGRASTASAWQVAAFVLLLLQQTAFSAPAPAAAANIILCIGDGTGVEQIKVGGWFKGTNLCFEGWTNSARVTTCSASSAITDSAAGATAMATGHKVKNGVLSVAIPGDRHELKTFLEHAKDMGKRTGLVTTTRVTDATPGAFGAHALSRTNYNQIAADYMERSRPDVILGGGRTGMSVTGAVAAGYVVVTNRAELLALNTANEARVSGQFGSGDMPYEQDGMGTLPHLSDMAGVALRVLEHGTNGFFLLVEGGLIDHACHINDVGRCVREVAEFDNAVQTVLNWCSNRTDTLVLVTADHETGGLTARTNNGMGANPAVAWKTTGHTATNVGIWARGPNAEAVAGVLDNTDVFHVMCRAMGLQGVAHPAGSSTNHSPSVP